MSDSKVFRNRSENSLIHKFREWFGLCNHEWVEHSAYTVKYEGRLVSESLTYRCRRCGNTKTQGVANIHSRH